MLQFFRSLEQRRKLALKRASHPEMLRYLRTPFPSSKWHSHEFGIVSLDFETTGLDPRKDRILSYGKVEIHRGAICLSTAEHGLINADQAVPESSAIIHHITDDQLQQGVELDQALPHILRFLRGKVLLVHFNQIELGFLDAACRRLYGSPFLIPTIDTLLLAERVLSRRNHSLEPGRLRLFNLRDDFKLPKYKAHDALCDALTTAELFLVLQGEISPEEPVTLKQVML